MILTRCLSLAWLLSGLLSTSIALAASVGMSVTAPRIEEWPVPWEKTRPRDPSVAPDGRVWFVGQVGNYLAVFDPEDASMQRIELPEGTRPHTVLVDDEGFPWVAGNGNGTILRFDPRAGEFTRFQVPDAEGLKSKDPHTFAFDGRGGLWFTLQRGNGIGHLDIASGTFRIAVAATANSLPYGIVSDAKGDAWAVALGAPLLFSVARESMQLREITLPRADARMRRLGIGSDGSIWYADFMQGYLGRYQPGDGSFKEWRTPSGRSGPYAMVTDDRGRAWLFETYPQPNLLQGFDMKTETWLPAAAVPSGGGVVRHMQYDAKRSSLWFGTDTNNLGRAQLP